MRHQHETSLFCRWDLGMAGVAVSLTHGSCLMGLKRWRNQKESSKVGQSQGTM